jgi:hypothetical protein
MWPRILRRGCLAESSGPLRKQACGQSPETPEFRPERKLGPGPPARSQFRECRSRRLSPKRGNRAARGDSQIRRRPTRWPRACRLRLALQVHITLSRRVSYLISRVFVAILASPGSSRALAPRGAKSRIGARRYGTRTARSTSALSQRMQAARGSRCCPRLRYQHRRQRARGANPPNARAIPAGHFAVCRMVQAH